MAEYPSGLEQTTIVTAGITQVKSYVTRGKIPFYIVLNETFTQN